MIDAGSAALGGAHASVADRTVLVAGKPWSPRSRGWARRVARVGPEPIVVLNRAPATTRPGPWHCPTPALGARLALGGREARGDLGRAIAELADLCEGLVTSAASRPLSAASPR